MSNILKRISRYRAKQNLIEVGTFFIHSLILLVLAMQIYGVIHTFYPSQIVANYWIAQSLKFIWIALVICLALRYEKRLLCHLQAARLIDQTCELSDDTVTNAYEMLTNTPDGNKLIIEKYLADVTAKVGSLKPAYNCILFKKALLFLLILMCGVAAQILIAPSTTISAARSFLRQTKPSEVYNQPISVSPGSTTISRGSSINIRVTNPFDKAEYTLFYRYEDLWRSESMPDRSKLFGNIDQSFEYFIKNQWTASDTFRVTVLADPVVQKLSLKYTYPDYIKKRTDFIEISDGNIHIPQFTEVEMTIETPETVVEAYLVFTDPRTPNTENRFLTLSPHGRNSWIVTFKPERNTSYHLSLIDELGTQNQAVNRTITIIPDAPPTISFIYPAQDTVMTQNNLFEVRLTAADDYGLRNLRIYYQINQNPARDSLLFRQSSQNFVIMNHLFDFRNTQSGVGTTSTAPLAPSGGGRGGVSLFPGDEITYWAVVFDNSPLNQRAETPRFKLRFPSIEDIFRELERQEEERSNILTRAYEEVQEMQREFDMKRREMLRKDEINWDDQKALEKFIDDQKALNEMVENVADNYHQMIEQLQQNEVVSQELLSKMQRIQEIMDQIATDDLKRAMEQMQQSLERANPNEIRQAMQNFQFNMEDFAEKLDQTLKLLQEIQNEINLERSLEIAKEMYNMQDEVNKKTENASDLSALSEEQRRIEEKLQALQEQMQKTLDDMQGSSSDLSQMMQDIMQDMKNSQLSENLQEASKAMQSNQKQSAMDAQSQSLSAMSRMIAKMEQMQSDMSGAGMDGMAEAIQASIYRFLMIAKEHQDKVRRIGNDPVPFMPAFINDYESIQLTINHLYQNPMILLVLGQKFFVDLNLTINAYRNLFIDFQDSKFNTHTKHTKDIQAGLNLIIYDLMQAMNNMQSGGGGGSGGMQSLMQQLQQMSTQQMMMNTLTQSLLEQMAAGGNRVTNQMRQQMQEIAAEEQRMAENLKRMMQTNPEAQKHANTLNELANELEDVARKIRQNRIDRNLVQQQDRIMSRLLEVQRSINKRDNSNQRRGETAEERLWEIPPDLNLNLQNASERKALEDEIQKLPLEYRQVILEYLRRMNE